MNRRPSLTEDSMMAKDHDRGLKRIAAQLSPYSTKEDVHGEEETSKETRLAQPDFNQPARVSLILDFLAGGSSVEEILVTIPI
jgi:hypothetical protein